MTVASSTQLPSSFESRWSSLRLQPDEAALWRVGQTGIYVQRTHGDWMIAPARDEIAGTAQIVKEVDCLPLDLDWKRWALDTDTEEIRFWPTFPERPLVVKTRIPVIIPPNASVQLYINLPIWLEVSVANRGEFMPLSNIPSAKLSSTWYGTPFEGQLCYAIKSRARRALEDLEEEALRAVCLFKIRNRSDQPLPVEKVRIQPEHLTLYTHQERLWTSSVSVSFKGKDEDSAVEYDSKAPAQLKDAQLVREAAIPQHHNSFIDALLFRNFHLHD